MPRNAVKELQCLQCGKLGVDAEKLWLKMGCTVTAIGLGTFMLAKGREPKYNWLWILSLSINSPALFIYGKEYRSLVRKASQYNGKPHLLKPWKFVCNGEE